MIKNEWYTSRKKIHIEKGTFRILIIGSFFYTLIASILFLVEYLDYGRWHALVLKNVGTFGSSTSSYQDIEDTVKVIYLARFWGSIGLMLLLQFSAFLFHRKIKYGFMFAYVWFLLIIGLFVISIIVIKSDPMFYVWKLIPLAILLLTFGYCIKEAHAHRNAVSQAFYLKVKKGEI